MSFETVPYEPAPPPGDALERARRFSALLAGRRSVRHFSRAPVPRELIDELVRTAGTAPSGANKQPWRFVAIDDPGLKREIRLAAEQEERSFYERESNQRWISDLRHLGTDANKPFLEDAPWLIVVFRLVRDDARSPGPHATDQVYYVQESVGIAVGMLLAAAQNAGLATLTHTPSPMGFLARLLERPPNERPFLIIPVGHPAEGCTVPDIERKSLDQIRILNRGE